MDPSHEVHALDDLAFIERSCQRSIAGCQIKTALTEDDVLAVEMRGRDRDDEKLAKQSKTMIRTGRLWA